MSNEVSPIFYPADRCESSFVVDCEATSPGLACAWENHKNRATVPKIRTGLSEMPEPLREKLIRQLDPIDPKLEIFTLTDALQQLKFVSLGLPSAFETRPIAIKMCSAELVENIRELLTKNGDEVEKARDKYEQLVSSSDDAIRRQIGWTLCDIIKEHEAMVFQMPVEGLTELTRLSQNISEAISSITRVAHQLLNNQQKVKEG